jgi:hypothetical protein
MGPVMTHTTSTRAGNVADVKVAGVRVLSYDPLDRVQNSSDQFRRGIGALLLAQLIAAKLRRERDAVN